ncbi:MAG: DUF4349 domain-containing protein [Cyanobacteria bacterium P01_A01_bin.135]
MMSHFSPQLASLSLGLIVLAGCSVPDAVNSQVSEESSPAALDRTAIDSAAVEGEPVLPPISPVPTAAPQLVKRASLALRVDAVADSLDALGTIARAQQGDILNLEGSGDRRATLHLRIPYDRLEAALEAIADLGQVTQRHISAEDVSTQLVDLEARLRNLRKTEEMLLGIMERSGDMGDVLQVTQEISQVRGSIEQLDAQRQQLRNRVRYSMVTVTLEAAIASPTAPMAIRDELDQTWQRATLSFRHVSVSLLKLALWLLVYSPYLGVLLLVGTGLYYLRRRTTDAGPA